MKTLLFSLSMLCAVSAYAQKLELSFGPTVATGFNRNYTTSYGANANLRYVLPHSSAVNFEVSGYHSKGTNTEFVKDDAKQFVTEISLSYIKYIGRTNIFVQPKAGMFISSYRSPDFKGSSTGYSAGIGLGYSLKLDDRHSIDIAPSADYRNDNSNSHLWFKTNLSYRFTLGGKNK